ncbi:MAG: hypothetical protein ABI667_03800 [Sphingomicrobium sp.]
MIPMKNSSIFRSRWFALIWAAGILWFALDVAGASEEASDNKVASTDATGAPVTSSDTKALEAAIANM